MGIAVDGSEDVIGESGRGEGAIMEETSSLLEEDFNPLGSVPVGVGGLVAIVFRL